MLKHIPVMTHEVMKSLNISADGIYVDGTLGRGGHASFVLKQLENGRLIGFDKDLEAIKFCNSLFFKKFKNFQLIHSDFRFMEEELKKLGIHQVDGIILDLGPSYPQLGNPKRGFSYQKDGPLDMRMNQLQSLTADIIINKWSECDLVRLINENADGKFAHQIVKAVVSYRPVHSTLELVDVVRKVLPAKVVRQKHPGKRLFQAIRMVVNDEIGAVQSLITRVPHILKKGGVLAVITFHSIEDRVVKQCFRTLITSDSSDQEATGKKAFSSKQFRPSRSEIKYNPRSRSAKLRILKKL